jgi:hypothetical protein
MKIGPRRTAIAGRCFTGSGGLADPERILSLGSRVVDGRSPVTCRRPLRPMGYFAGGIGTRLRVGAAWEEGHNEQPRLPPTAASDVAEAVQSRRVWAYRSLIRDGMHEEGTRKSSVSEGVYYTDILKNEQMAALRLEFEKACAELMLGTNADDDKRRQDLAKLMLSLARELGSDSACVRVQAVRLLRQQS